MINEEHQINNIKHLRNKTEKAVCIYYYLDFKPDFQVLKLSDICRWLN